MDNSREAIVGKLQKLLAMRDRGFEGEASNAGLLLEKHMAKYGLTIADLTDDVREWYEPKVSPHSSYEKRLVKQIVYMLTGEQPVCGSRRRSKKIFVKLSKAEQAEFEIVLNIFKADLSTVLDDAVRAFFYKNDIFPKGVEVADPDKRSPEELAAIQRALAMAGGIKRSHVRKQIGSEN